MREKADEEFNRFKSAGEAFEKFIAEDEPEESEDEPEETNPNLLQQTAIERIFEMYARDEEKHFMEEAFSAEQEAKEKQERENGIVFYQRDSKEEFKRAFGEHILGDLWMLRFGKEETQQKIEELWEELCED